MVRLTHTRREWLAIAHELATPGRAAPLPGLNERIRSLIEQAPADWPDQAYALELDIGCADAVRATQAALAGRDPTAGERGDALRQAEAIVRDHQRSG